MLAERIPVDWPERINNFEQGGMYGFGGRETSQLGTRKGKGCNHKDGTYSSEPTIKGT
jgi:hypothetical protein